MSSLLLQQKSNYMKRGFTIVELLIVVVVVAILAAITVIAYNGITGQAKESAAKSDLTTAAKKLHVGKIEGDGQFPSSKPGYMDDTISYSGGGNSFCISKTLGGKTFIMREAGGVEEGECVPAAVAATIGVDLGFNYGHTGRVAYGSGGELYYIDGPAVYVANTSTQITNLDGVVLAGSASW